MSPKSRHLLITVSVLFFIGAFTVMGLYLLDFLWGDGNGDVAGIDISTASEYLFYFCLAYGLWLGFKLKIGWLPNLLFPIIMTVGSLMATEWVCGKIVVSKEKSQPVFVGPEHSMERDELLGYKPLANAEHQGKRTKDGKVIYDISYATDAHSRRITPMDSMPRSRFAQFFGCSMTFGEGVQSDETLPYYFSQFDTSFHAYNYGYSGYGPHQMLARMEALQAQKLVKEKSGVGYYLYINDHINRVIGSMTNYSYNKGHAPYYTLGKKGLERKGLFSDGRKIRSRIYDKLLKSNILKLFQIGYPFKLKAEDFELTASVIARSATLFQEQTGGSPFYVVIYPSIEDRSQMVDLLRNKGLQVLDFSKLFDPYDPKYMILDDGHQTPLANQIIAKELIKNLPKNGN